MAVDNLAVAHACDALERGRLGRAGKVPLVRCDGRGRGNGGAGAGSC